MKVKSLRHPGQGSVTSPSLPAVNCGGLWWAERGEKSREQQLKPKLRVKTGPDMALDYKGLISIHGIFKLSELVGGEAVRDILTQIICLGPHRYHVFSGETWFRWSSGPVWF